MIISRAQVTSKHGFIRFISVSILKSVKELFSHSDKFVSTSTFMVTDTDKLH